ncbi:hypothetical protein [Paraburkholderia sp. J41]|nr:hypothetical protein [Paraburkholderia sp. J41]
MQFVSSEFNAGNKMRDGKNGHGIPHLNTGNRCARCANNGGRHFIAARRG